MIGYRLLPPAEEEMTEAALFYEAARSGLGDTFLDDIQHAIDSVRRHPELGESVAYGFRRVLVRRLERAGNHHGAQSCEPAAWPAAQQDR